MKLEVKLVVKCNSCDSELDLYERSDGTIGAEPCAACVEDSYDAGRREGAEDAQEVTDEEFEKAQAEIWQAGWEEGYDEGVVYGLREGWRDGYNDGFKD